MHKYKIEFLGQERLAIGAFSEYTEIVEAESPRAALLKLYERFNSIHRPKITEV